jgi:hypothetical protein
VSLLAHQQNSAIWDDQLVIRAGPTSKLFDECSTSGVRIKGDETVRSTVDLRQAGTGIEASFWIAMRMCSSTPLGAAALAEWSCTARRLYDMRLPQRGH